MDVGATNRKIKKIKRHNGKAELTERQVKKDPFEQFIDWFHDELSVPHYDPTAMVLATVDKHGWPDTRVVLLKEVQSGQFIFYTNYKSVKAKQLLKNKVVALNFYWPNHSRQVRIRGHVKKLDRKHSEMYFATRPKETQIGAHAWVQSTQIAGRQEMEKKIKLLSEKFGNKKIPCPDNWGGYVVIPFEYEFFQGRKWRRHDRFLYTLEKKKWKRVRLAP